MVGYSQPYRLYVLDQFLVIAIQILWHDLGNSRCDIRADPWL